MILICKYKKYKYLHSDNNNLYFGFNGIYEYCFESPVTKYVLAQYKKYKIENVVMENLNEISENEDVFVKKLKEHIKLESVTIPLDHAYQD